MLFVLKNNNWFLYNQWSNIACRVPILPAACNKYKKGAILNCHNVKYLFNFITEYSINQYKASSYYYSCERHPWLLVKQNFRMFFYRSIDLMAHFVRFTNRCSSIVSNVSCHRWFDRFQIPTNINHPCFKYIHHDTKTIFVFSVVNGVVFRLYSESDEVLSKFHWHFRNKFWIKVPV